MAGAKAYTEEQLSAVLGSRAFRTYNASLRRNRALYAVGLAIGCRVSELVTIRRMDVLDQYGTIRPDWRIWQKKTSTYRTVPAVNHLIYAYLPPYLEELDRLGYFRKTDWLFPGRNDGHISVRTVNRIYAAAHRELRMSGYSSHSTRKTWAIQVYTQITAANRTGKTACDPFQKLCELGGWRSYDAARRYIADAVDNRREIMTNMYRSLKEEEDER